MDKELNSIKIENSTFGNPWRIGRSRGDKHQTSAIRSILHLKERTKRTSDERLQRAFLVSDLHCPAVQFSEVVAREKALKRDATEKKKAYAEGDRRANTSRSPPFMSSKTLHPSHVILQSWFEDRLPSSSSIAIFSSTTELR